MDKGKKHHVEFLEAGEDAAEAFESSKEALDLVASAVHGAVVLPSGDAILLGRNDGDVAEVKCQLSGFIAFVGPVHQQVDRPCSGSQSLQKLASFWRIVRLTGRERKSYGRSSIRGNQMNFGIPSAPGFSDGLWSVFFNAPVPSGCTLTEVLSSETASIRTRTI